MKITSAIGNPGAPAITGMRAFALISLGQSVRYVEVELPDAVLCNRFGERVTDLAV